MKIFGYELKRFKEPVNDEEYQSFMWGLFQYVNTTSVIPIGGDLTQYLTRGYAYNPLVYSAINFRANAAKGIPWLVYKVKDKQKHKLYKAAKTADLKNRIVLKESSLDEVEGTPLNRLIERPNQDQSFAEIIEALFIFRDATGNSYLFTPKNETMGYPLAMYVMPADKVRIEAGANFMQPVKGYTMREYVERPLPADQVIHWKYYNPIFKPNGSHLYGLSPLAAAAMVVTQENMAMVFQSNAFHNEGLKAIITGTQHTDIEFTQEQATELRKNFIKNTGFRNAKNIAFNRAPLQKLQIGESPVDLGVIDARRLNKELICNVFRIHPALLSTDASTLNNLTEARKALLTISVLPDMDTFRSILNERVAKSFGEDYYIDYDFMAISELQDDIHKLAATMQTMDWITDNEKRAATQYDAYPDKAADQLYKPAGLMPIGYDFDTGFDRIDEELNKHLKTK